jgi:hypothetical protein
MTRRAQCGFRGVTNSNFTTFLCCTVYVAISEQTLGAIVQAFVNATREFLEQQLTSVSAQQSTVSTLASACDDLVTTDLRSPEFSAPAVLIGAPECSLTHNPQRPVSCTVEDLICKRALNMVHE